MNTDLLIALVGGFFVMMGLLFLSGIHIFMIPRDILKKECTPRTDEKTSSTAAEPDASAEALPKD